MQLFEHKTHNRIMASPIPCYLGIDVGTQGLTALLVESKKDASDKSSLKVLAIGEGSYEFVPDLPEGCYEHDPKHWEEAFVEALHSIQEKLEEPVSIDALCVTGQMHGCVMIDENGQNIGNARLWCDARNQEEVGQRCIFVRSIVRAKRNLILSFLFPLGR